MLNLDGRDGARGMRSTKGRSRDPGGSGMLNLLDSRKGEQPDLIDQRLLS